jgi:hypothetical protein
VDDGVSGALATKLMGRARMLGAAADEKFSVLIVRDVDRLRRNDEELPGIIHSLPVSRQALLHGSHHIIDGVGFAQQDLNYLSRPDRYFES